MDGEPKRQHENERRMVSSVALCEEDFVCSKLRRLATSVYYTYILESETKPGERYIGQTSDLKNRLKEHNTGICSHTTKFKPWRIRLYIAFETADQAQHFERYLKSGSGHAFADRHFWS
jgi:putative endonuclease